MCVSCIKLWFYWCCCSFLPFAFNVVITRKRDWERCHVPFPDYVEPIENCIDEASLEEVTGLLSTSNPLRNKFLFSSWMKWQTFLTWIMSNPKKNRQQLQMTRRSIYRTKEIWLGRQPEAYYTSVCLRSYISVCSIDRFLYYVYIFYHVIVLHFRIIPPFVSVCPPRFVHRTAFWPKSSQSGNNQQSKCTKLRGFSSGQKLK